MIAPRCLVAAGGAQLALALASLAIPRVLDWRRETERLGGLNRAVFRTYAAYIWGTNLAFGLLSALQPRWLLFHPPFLRGVVWSLLQPDALSLR